jgi:hypothetical protein
LVEVSFNGVWAANRKKRTELTWGSGGEIVGCAETVLEGISGIGRGRTGEDVGSGVRR